MTSMMDNTLLSNIRKAIKSKYTSVSASATGYFKYPTGRSGLEHLGYEEQFFASLPEQIVDSFCGVGNPFAVDTIQPGEIILDIGSGAGFDLIYASQLVGEDGKVFGIDLTPEMVNKAASNIQLLQLSNVSVQEGVAEKIPFPNETFDVVISNGVINLSPQKEVVFSEIFRVLKKGGRVQFADIILEDNVKTIIPTDLESWSN